jgi:hypothetical protein
VRKPPQVVVLGDHDGDMFTNFIMIQVVYNHEKTFIDKNI